MSQILTFEYNETIDPAIPVLEVNVDGYSDRPPYTLTALIDSGADCTMIPVEVLEAVEASYEDSMRMRGVVGESQIVDRYLVGITIGQLTIPVVQAIANNEEAIIGRDVLNKLLLTLNGPAHMTEIQIL
jgi:predicted aspartyl protease